MTDKKSKCGCGCIGQKPGSAVAISDKKKVKKSKKSK